MPPERIHAAQSPPGIAQPLPPIVQDTTTPLEAPSGDGSSHVVNGCQCRNSRCSKMYCECFANNAYCTADCGCVGCENFVENESTLERIRSGIRRRNSNAFTAKIDRRSGMRKHTRGCRCTKSKCVKRYCECYREATAVYFSLRQSTTVYDNSIQVSRHTCYVIPPSPRLWPKKHSITTT